MKDSGIVWIGEIPKGWSIIKFKYILQKRKEILKEYTNEDVLSLTMKGVIKRDLENPTGKMPASFDGYQKIYKENLLLCLFDIDVTPRCVGLIKDNGITSPAYSQYELIGNNYNKFFYYQLLAIDNDKVLVNFTKSLRNTLTDLDFGSLMTVRPDYKDQVKIAEFLDKKTTEINDLVEKTKLSIEELKAYKQSLITETVIKGLNPNIEMKDSGIEWIGEIPNNWDIAPIKRIFKVFSGGTPKTTIDEYWDGDIPWITPADYNTEMHYISKGARNISQKGLENSSTNLIPSQSIILSKRAPIGKVVINTTEVTTNQGCLASVPKLENLVNNEYIYFLLTIFTNQLNMLGSGTTFKELSLGNYKNFLIPIPSLEEQDEIVEHLDKRTKEIDNLIDKKQRMLEELESYKQSLIYEYVTGKKEVE